MRDEKTEKKIEKEKKSARYWLETAVADLDKIKAADSDRKREKYQKALDKDKKYIKMSVEAVIKYGETIEDIVDNLSEREMAVWKELYGESDTDMIGVEKEITRIKKMLNEDLKKAMEKTDYDPADPIQDKMKNRRFSEEAHIGAHLASASRKNDFVGDGLNKEYNPYWNYQRDYESTKDKYFTEEEQRLIEKCRESHKEQYAYLLEKRAWMGKMGESLIETAGKIEAWADITQAKVWVKNLYEDLFPLTVKELYGKMPKLETEKLSKDMARRYIHFLCDDKAVEEALKIYEQTESKVSELKKQLCGTMNITDPFLLSKTPMELEELRRSAHKEMDGISVLALYLLRESVGLEMTSFISLLKWDSVLEARREAFKKYSLEELGL